MSERKKFYEEHNPLPNWHIWVGKYEGVDWDLRYKHQGYSLVVEGQKDTSKPSEQLITMGVQSSIFVIGGLLILVFSSNDENARAFLENYRINFLNKIWPPTGTELVWKETGVNNDEGTLFLSDLLLRDMQKMHIDLMKLLDEKKANKNA